MIGIIATLVACVGYALWHPMSTPKTNDGPARATSETKEPLKTGGTVCKTNLEDSDGNFKSGETYCATITAVRESAVYVRMPGGKGGAQISSKCWGKGDKRARALAALKPGDKLDVVVKAYDKRVQVLTLVLAEQGIAPNSVPVKRSVKKVKVRHAAKKSAPVERKANLARKSAYQPVKEGTAFLFDTANLVGKIGPEHAAAYLSAIATWFESRGYPVCFFWERRALGWACRKQENAEEVGALMQFSRQKNVSLVGEESDLAILQAAEKLANSVVVTQDRFDDYATTFPEIVSTARHRSFSIATIAGRKLLTIYGLPEAIELPEYFDETTGVNTAMASSAPAEAADDPLVVEDWAVEVDEDVRRLRAERPIVPPRRWGLLGVADACLARGENERAFALIGRVARKHPKAYREIADAFANGRGVDPNAWMVSHYDRLADRREKALRERLRRNRRHAAEHRRADMSTRVAA